MSSKSDRDNRSNQLNPNNYAYHSSRAGNSHSDDCDGECGFRLGFDLSNHIRVVPKIKAEGDYGVGLVTAEGEPRFFTFKLEASEERSTLVWQDSVLHWQLVDYLDRFTNALLWLVTSHYKARPKLFVIFDGTSSRLPWHVPLHADQPELMREFLLEEKPNVIGMYDSEETSLHALLCSVLKPPYENWGTFEAERQSVSRLHFIYEHRCRDALAR